jgi:cytochrome c peroxidase
MGNLRILHLAILLLALLLAGVVWHTMTASANPQQIEADLRRLIEQEGLQPLTALSLQVNPAQIELGQALFFETDLSGNRDVSCATCHHPAFALGDGLPLAIGTGGSGVGPERQLGEGRQFVPRHTPDLANRGRPEWTVMFWDGRIEGTAESGFVSPAAEYLPPGLDNALAVQVMMAVVSRHEMRGGMYDAAGYLIQPGEEPDSRQQQPLGWSDRDIYGRKMSWPAWATIPR